MKSLSFKKDLVGVQEELLRFAIREGGRTVGSGAVATIIE